MTQVQAHAAPARHKQLYQHLYFQVVCAIIIGILLGYFYPKVGEQMKPFGDTFIKLIKMMIGKELPPPERSAAASVKVAAGATVQNLRVPGSVASFSHDISGGHDWRSPGEKLAELNALADKLKARLRNLR